MTDKLARHGIWEEVILARRGSASRGWPIWAVICKVCRGEQPDHAEDCEVAALEQELKKHRGLTIDITRAQAIERADRLKDQLEQCIEAGEIQMMENAASEAALERRAGCLEAENRALMHIQFPFGEGGWCCGLRDMGVGIHEEGCIVAETLEEEEA